MIPYSLELQARTLIHDRLAEATNERLVNLARTAARAAPSSNTPLRRRAAASLRRLAHSLDGETLVAAPC